MATLNDLKAMAQRPELAHKKAQLDEAIRQLEGFASRVQGLTPDQWAQLFQMILQFVQIFIHPTPAPTPGPAQAPKPPPGPAGKK
jgi:hypothetical protein